MCSSSDIPHAEVDLSPPSLFLEFPHLCWTDTLELTIFFFIFPPQNWLYPYVIRIQVSPTGNISFSTEETLSVNLLTVTDSGPELHSKKLRRLLSGWSFFFWWIPITERSTSLGFPSWLKKMILINFFNPLSGYLQYNITSLQKESYYHLQNLMLKLHKQYVIIYQNSLLLFTKHHLIV